MYFFAFLLAGAPFEVSAVTLSTMLLVAFLVVLVYAWLAHVHDGARRQNGKSRRSSKAKADGSDGSAASSTGTGADGSSHGGLGRSDSANCGVGEDADEAYGVVAVQRSISVRERKRFFEDWTSVASITSSNMTVRASGR